MSHYHIAQAQTPDEFLELLTFVGRMVKQQAPFCYALPGDLNWWRRAISIEQTLSEITIWRREGAIVGFGWANVDQIDSIYDDSDPHIWESIVAHYANSPFRHYQFWAMSQQKRRQAVLADYGYKVSEAGFRMHMMRPSDAPRITVPDGFVVRHVDDSLNDSRAACQRSAFNSTKMTSEIYQQVRTLPSYTHQWDRVMINTDGMVVAFCTIWLDRVSGHALFEPVGCHQEYHRQGLTRALICQSLHDLADAGVHAAHVMSINKPDGAAARLYRSCGFQLIDELVPWQAE